MQYFENTSCHYKVIIILYPSFQAAAIARGLLEDSNEAIHTLNEAYTVLSSTEAFRSFFCNFICNSTYDVRHLWELFKHHLSEDILHQQRVKFQNPNIDFHENIFILALYKIHKLLKADGSDLKFFPTMQQLSPREITFAEVFFDEHNSHIPIIDTQAARSFFNENFPKLNSEQRQAFDILTTVSTGNI